MSAPKHLWSGDWQRDSEAAARERAQKRPPLTEPLQETEDAPVSKDAPVSRARSQPPRPTGRRTASAPPESQARPLANRVRLALASMRASLRLGRAQARLMAIVAVVALLVVGGAYGLNALVDNSSNAQPTAVNTNAWLGLQMQSLANGAVVISSVVPGSPASSAGLRPGDVIAEIESRPVGAPIDVTEAVAALQAGDTIELQLVRGSTTYMARVKLTARPSSFP